MGGPQIACRDLAHPPVPAVIRADVRRACFRTRDGVGLRDARVACVGISLSVRSAVAAAASGRAWARRRQCQHHSQVSDRAIVQGLQPRVVHHEAPRPRVRQPIGRAPSSSPRMNDRFRRFTQESSNAGVAWSGTGGEGLSSPPPPSASRAAARMSRTREPRRRGPPLWWHAHRRGQPAVCRSAGARSTRRVIDPSSGPNHGSPRPAALDVDPAHATAALLRASRPRGGRVSRTARGPPLPRAPRRRRQRGLPLSTPPTNVRTVRVSITR